MKALLFVMSMVFVVGCKKDDKATDDTTLPSIAINSPTANQVFSAGQSVSVSAIITDNNKLGEIHLEIINTTTGAFVAHEHFNPGTASYTLAKTFTTAAATTYKIKFEAHDASNNVARTDITVTSN